MRAVPGIASIRVARRVVRNVVMASGLLSLLRQSRTGRLSPGKTGVAALLAEIAGRWQGRPVPASPKK